MYAKLQPKTLQDVENGVSEKDGVTVATKVRLKLHSGHYLA